MVVLLSVRKILWNRGYFATFFFNTRFQPFFYAALLCYYSNRKFEINLKLNEVYSYYNKLDFTERTKKSVQNNALKMEIQDKMTTMSISSPK
jgi:hypothetical protein